MNAKKKNRIVLIPPNEESVHELWIRSIDEWLKGRTQIVIKNDDLKKCLEGDTSDLIVLFGEPDPQEYIFESNSADAFLKGKVIYSFGCSKINSAKDLVVQYGLSGFVGYEQFDYSLRIGELERLFLKTPFSLIDYLLDGHNLGNAIEKSKDSWDQFIDHVLNKHPIYEDSLIISMMANVNKKRVFAFGDNNWFLPENSEILIFAEHNFSPPKARIQIVDISHNLIEWLRQDPKRMTELTPENFENLIADRLTNMGFWVSKTGSTFTPDGGIDLIACPKSGELPFLIAAQVKHSKSGRPIGAQIIRDFRGAIAPHPIDVGLVVTNTNFTINADWTAKQLPRLIRLRDFNDLRNWLSNEFDDSLVLRDIPDSIEVAPGLVVKIPRFI
jgi:HJR/Mrr/RecB family endonuclease